METGRAGNVVTAADLAELLPQLLTEVTLTLPAEVPQLTVIDDVFCPLTT